MRPPRLAVVGVHGYGASHVLRARSAERRGAARLVGLVDPRRAPVVRDGVRLEIDELPPFHPTLAALLAAETVDVVVIATPLHTHAALLCQALEAGADVLVEKPPVTGRGELAAVLACAESTGGLVQVGFQGLGSRALRALANGMRQGALGRVVRVGAYGSWSRDRAYYERAPWAGRRHLSWAAAGTSGSSAPDGATVTEGTDGVDVMDGTLTNPFAHAVMGLLHLAGLRQARDVATIELDLYHAHDIEADDTSSLRITPAAPGGRADGQGVGVLSAAFTLAGPREDPPVIEVVGTDASARLSYTDDRLEITGPDPGGLAGQYERDDLLDDLLAVREVGGRLLAPLTDMGAFVEVVEAVRSVEPVAVADRHVRWHGEGVSAHPVIDGIEDALRACVTSGRLLGELDLEWTRRAPRTGDPMLTP